MTSQGSAYARFRRALQGGNPAIVRAAAAELPTVTLEDALEVCVVMLQDRDRYERFAVRWLGRFCLEARGATLDDVQLAAAAFADLHLFPNQAVERLRELCEQRGLLRRSRAATARARDAKRGGPPGSV